MSTGSRQPTRGIAIAAIALLCLIWGSTWFVIRQGLEDLPVLTSAAFRFTLAGAVLVLLGPLLHRWEGGRRPGLGLTLVMGVCNFSLSYGIVYWGETVIYSGLASVLWAVFPLFVAALGHYMLPGERLGAGQAVGFVVGFLGVTLLFVTDLRAIGGGALALGAVFLLSPLSAALGQTIVKRHGTHVSASLLNRNGMIVGAILLWAVALPLEETTGIHWTPRAIFSVVYLALVGTVVSFGLYFWLLRSSRSYRLSLIAYVTPAVALLLGTGLGGEPLRSSTLGGAALILAGVAMVMRKGPGATRLSDDSSAASPGRDASSDGSSGSGSPREPTGG